MPELGSPLITPVSNVGVENFMKGFALVAEDNRRKQQNAIDMQRMLNQKLAQDNQFTTETEKNRIDLLKEQDYAKHLGATAQAAQKAQQDQANVDQRWTEAAGKLYSIPVKPGTEDYPTELNTIGAEYADLAQDGRFNSLINRLQIRHEAAAKQALQAQGKLQTSYTNAINGLGTNYNLPLNTVHNFFANPDIWHFKDGKAYVDYDKDGHPIPPNNPNKQTWENSLTVKKADYDTIQKKREAAYPPDATFGSQPDVSAVSSVQSIPVVKTEDDYHRIPSGVGAQYVDPNGVTRTKP